MNEVMEEFSFNIRMSIVPSPSSRSVENNTFSYYNIVMKSSLKAYHMRMREKFAHGLELMINF